MVKMNSGALAFRAEPRWEVTLSEADKMRVQDGPFPIIRVIEKLATSDKVTLTRTSSTWSGASTFSSAKLFDVTVLGMALLSFPVRASFLRS
jgi:hypothetical protein